MRGTATVANEAALAGWDGPEGDRWLRNEEAFDRSIARYDEAWLAAAGIRPGDRVLDVGCGTGLSTREAARRAAPGGEALGVDLSSVMLARARERAAAEGLVNARFEQADAQAHPFRPGGFDVVVSRTGTMFFGDPGAAFANLAAALRPGGRLSMLVWQAPPFNEWFAAFVTAAAAGAEVPLPPPDAPTPFSLADPARVHGILGGAGFTDVGLRAVQEPMWFGADVDEALPFVTGLGPIRALLKPHDEDTRRQAVGALRRSLEAHAGPDGVIYASAMWIVTATRG